MARQPSSQGFYVIDNATGDILFQCNSSQQFRSLVDAYMSAGTYDLFTADQIGKGTPVDSYIKA